MLYCFSLLKKLLCCVVHSCSLLSWYIKSRHDRPVSATHCYWETVIYSFRNPIGIIIGPSAKWYPVIFVVKEPTSHMSYSCIGSTCSTWKPSSINDFGASFLNSWDKLFCIPIFFNFLQNRLPFNSSPLQVRWHCWRMITPYNNFLNIIDCISSFLSNLPDCSIMIKSCHCTKILFG